MPNVTIVRDAKKVVVVDEDHGGYLAGHCTACDESGWLEVRHGFPHQAKGIQNNYLKHKVDCPMNAVLNNDGSFKGEPEPTKPWKQK